MTDKYKMALDAMDRMLELLKDCGYSLEDYKLRVEGLGGWAVNHQDTIREALLSKVKYPREERECEICGTVSEIVNSDGVGLICCQPQCKE